MLNATLAGAVMMGANAELLVTPFIPLCMGFAGGVISTLGFEFVPRILLKYLKFHDTAGVTYLHFIPGVLGGLASGLIAGTTNEWYYGNTLSDVYQQMGPGSNRGHST